MDLQELLGRFNKKGVAQCLSQSGPVSQWQCDLLPHSTGADWCHPGMSSMQDFARDCQDSELIAE